MPVWSPDKPDPPRVLICGSRTWTDRKLMAQVMGDLPVGTVIIYGAHWAGADAIAGELADYYGLRKLLFPAQWNRFGRLAGPLRNSAMLTQGKPDVVYAFRCMGKSDGTDDMVEKALKAGVPVVRIWETGEKESL